jgi:hypothetical protein
MDTRERNNGQLSSFIILIFQHILTVSPNGVVDFATECQ